MTEKLGISKKEARRLLFQYGLNEITLRRKKTVFTIFFSQFKSALIWLLLAASLIAFALGDILDSVFILLIVFINATLGFVQEYRAERAIQALKRLSVSKTTVFRDGQEEEIDSRFLVAGDVIKLNEGDKVPADAVLLETVNLEVNEASLTGESLPVFKKEGEEEHNRVFLGTIVVRGRGIALVERTGMQTRFGSIARGLSEISEGPTPLQRQLTILGRQLTIAAVFASLLVFALGIVRSQDFFTMFFTGVSLAVAAVPEGLPAVITITLAVGMHRMAKKRALARKMAAIETLGAATLIAADKTGTITKNEMRVREFFAGGKKFPISNFQFPISNELRELLRIGVIVNTASLVFKHEQGPSVFDPEAQTRRADRFDVIGDPTEGALLLAASEIGLNPNVIKEEGELLDEFSFDATRKTMSVVWRWHQGGDVAVLAKGAPEAILKRSTSVLRSGKTIVLTKEEKDLIEAAFQAEASRGFRIIAMARKKMEDGKWKMENLDRDEVESDLTFVGFAAIFDPPRTEVREAAKEALEAGIKTVIITGDNELTANAVAEEVGLIKEGEDILTGEQLNKISDEELLKILPNVRIFARTTPEHKLRIVRAYQKLGHIVSVTGDGVNDALALKQANVGVAMGIAGTDVAKETADLVVTDDNYATIVRAVEEGRLIFDNIVKAVLYLVSGNLGELLTIFIAVAAGFPAPLLPSQILWINLVTDGLPALALAFDPKEPSLMRRRPRILTQSILKGGNVRFIALVGIGLALLVFSLFMTSLLSGSSLEKARTIAFTTLIIFHLGIVFLVRKDHSLFSNKFLVAAVLIVFFLQALILFVPALQPIFKVSPLW